jgi:mannose-6-phosphate isomerase
MIAKLHPNRVRRTYLGGGRIDAFCGVFADVSDGVPRPEDWIASTIQAFNGSAEIAGEGLGRLEDGRLVKDVVGSLPILVKLLDSDERLVIQAHPTVPCAKRLFNSSVGKTECWYFLPGTAPDACVYLGFKPGVTRQMWREAFEAQEGLLDLLHRIPVKAGDFVFVDGGVPHAIGGGCFMVELQEPSDLMVVAERFTPSGRRIPDAKMHGGVGWEKMFDVYEYGGCSFEELCTKYVSPANSLRDCVCGPGLTDKFSMWRVAGGGNVEMPRSAGVAVVTGTGGEVNGLAVRKGDRLLLADECQVKATVGTELVLCV